MCPRRIMFQRFAANRVERDLVGVALSTFTKAAQQRPEVASFEMGGKGERFGLGWQPAGCETQHDLVSRARGKQKYTALPEIYGASAERYSPSLHFGATHPPRYREA
jgi:hypothetical protein